MKVNYYKENKNIILNNNIIDELKISSTNFICSDFIENPDYGTEFEHTISTKSCLHLDIHSINSKKIFTKQNRKFFGLKLVVIKNNNYDLIPKLLDEGKFKVLPFSNKYYRMKYFNCEPLLISYNNEGVFVTDEYFHDYLYFDNYTYYNYHSKSKTSKNDNYIGYIQLTSMNSQIIEIFIYSSSCEIDGLFEVCSDFDLEKYKVNKVYKNNENETIKKNSILIYEIKSGFQEDKLINQMYERGFFIYKYLECVYDRPIYYIGFFINNPNESININIKKNKIKNEQIAINKMNNYIYNLLGKFPFNIIILSIKDTIFGEKIIYEKEELNLIYNINERLKFLNESAEKFELRTKMNLQEMDEKYDQKTNYCNTKITSIEYKITSIENKITNIEIILKNILKEIKEMKDKV